MLAPFDTFLKSLRDTDTAGDQMRKMLAAYRASSKQSGRLVPFRKADLTVDDLTDDDVDEINGNIDARAAGETEGSASSRHISHLADLVAESTGAARKAVLGWMLHHKDGLALIRRTLGKRLQKKETQTMTYDRSAELTSIIKQFGPVALAKHLVENGPSGLSEHEFTSMVNTWAEANNTTFVKLFTAQNSDGLALRRATQVLKGFGSAGPVHEAVAGGTAFDQLSAKASEYRKDHPELTGEQSFAKVFSDPANRELARAERAANRPA
jgi:hypothetical protein